MSIALNKKVGEMSYDGLIADLTPPAEVRARTIAKQATETTYKRGTVFAKGRNDKKLYILGSAETTESGALVQDCILCDDITVGTTEDMPAAVYTAGCFDPDKVIAKTDYTITEADKDELRKRNIAFKAAFSAN